MVDFPWGSRPVPFEQYMEFCLYDPQRGYYRRGRPVFGKRGDYFTSPYTHPLFAELLSRALASYLQELAGEAEALDLVELGAGERVLAADLLRFLERDRPRLFRRVRYRAVEVDAPELPERVRGVVFSNEFFDALPVHRVRVRGGELREIHVQGAPGEVHEVEVRPARPAIEAYMRRAFPVWREGYAYEVNLRMLEVLSRLDRVLERGTVLTIDYGYRWPEYDGRPRSEGTLLCYHRHQPQPDPYRLPGEQDITSHVNFDVLLEEGERLGWRSEPLATQREFLLRWGLEQRLQEEEEGLWRDERLEERLGLRELLRPGGISDVAKVGVQQK